MFKALVVISLFAVLLLCVATAILVRFNWSEKLYSPLLSIFIAGLVTTFITVLLMSKGETFGRSFTSFIVVNTETHLPPLLFFNPSNKTKLMGRLSDYLMLAQPKIQDETGSERVLFEGPRTDEDETTFYEELLQYKILMEIIDIHNPNQWVSTAVGGQGFAVSDNRSFTLTESDKKPLMDVVPEVTTNRFSRNPVEEMSIKLYKSRLPRDTTIELKQIKSSGKQGDEQHLVTVTKPYFFTLEIVIKPGMGSGVGSLPPGSGVVPELMAKCKTLAFEISMTAKFEKLTGGNYRTEELKNWAKWVFSQLESKFSDNTPEG